MVGEEEGRRASRMGEEEIGEVRRGKVGRLPERGWLG